MRKLVYSAVALTLVSVPGFASENEWSSLDQEINNLSSSLSAQNAPGPKVSGYIRTSFRYSTDEEALFGGSGNTEKESGFKLDKIRIEITGDAGLDYSYKVSFDLAGGSATLKDAYVTWKMAENVKGTMGQFTKPVLRSALISDKNLLFTERTALGAFFRPRDTGLMFSGTFDTIEWSIAGQNGLDGKQDKYNYSARLAANLMGSGVGKVEGAYGAGQETNLTAGLAWADDKALDEGRVIAVDAALTSGPFSIAGEYVKFQKGTTVSGVNIFGNKDGDDLHFGSSNSNVSVNPADESAWDITASYMFTNEYEGAIRYEDAKDGFNASPSEDVKAWSACVNRYVQGHDIKWTLGYLKTKSDDSAQELGEWTLGLTVGI
jgi:hypothetical protein